VSLKQGILTPEREKLLLSIGFDFEPLVSQRKELLIKFQEYFNEFGTVNVPTKYVTLDGYKLGVALDRIRQLRKNESEWDHGVVEFLESKDILWNVKSVLEELSFQNGIRELDKYLKRSPLSEITQSTITDTGFKLGPWINRMRQKNKANNLSSEHEFQLTSRGIELLLIGVQYGARIAFLREFYVEHGHIRVPQSLKPNGLGSIYLWLGDQKKRRVAGLLSDEEIANLDQFKFIWENENELIKSESWQKFHAALIEFKESTGTCIVPSEFRTESNYALGAVVAKYRGLYKKNELTREKVDELNAIRFVWNVSRPKKFSTPRVQLPDGTEQQIERRTDRNWKRFIAALKVYKAEHGNLLIPGVYKDSNNFILGQTAVEYRMAYRRGELITEKVEILNSLEFPWEVEKPNNAQFYWENFVGELNLYKSTFGNLDVPNEYVSPSGFRLGNRTRYTRTLNNKGELENYKIEQLSLMEFPWGRKR
jgi:hypothetical protein